MNDTYELIYKRETDSHTYRINTVPRVAGGIDREFGIHHYLLSLELTTNKDLLYIAQKTLLNIL